MDGFSKKCIDENNREFSTAKNNEWYINKNSDEITFKLINVKEVYQHNKSLDIK